MIDSAQTLAALGCARELYQTFVPGTTSWLDPDNNEAFLAGRISLTANGVSVYYAAKNSDDPGLKAIAEDIRHANFPVGPVGTPTELFLISQAMVFNHTPYPNAAKAYLLVHVGARAVRAVAEGIAFGAFPGRDGLPTR